MSVSHNCPCIEACPLQYAMEMIGGKWKLPIQCALAMDGTIRYNDIKGKLGDISNTMLAKSLKEHRNDLKGILSSESGALFGVSVGFVWPIHG